MKRLFIWVGLLVVAVSTAHAHIGSPTVFFEGQAGPYPIRVVIRPPQAVPGRAEISVRITTNGVQRVTVLPVRWNAGKKGAPPPDEALPVRGEPDLYSAELWLMDSGAYSVFIEITGNAGQGEAIVPVNSLATERLALPPWLGGVLLLLGVALFLGMASIAGAAVGESVLSPGEQAGRTRRMGAWVARAGMALLVAGLLYAGKRWWDKVELHHRANRLFRPMEMDASLSTDGPSHLLRLSINDAQWKLQDRRPLVPDHGKLMHLFLIREPQMDAFAHLHPVRHASTKFETVLPSLPAGQYRLFGDVTHESGFSHTLVAKLTIPESQSAAANMPAPALLDPDDSWWTALNTPTTKGWQLRWERPAEIVMGRETPLRFKLVNAAGNALPLEAYMGMMAHAVICHEDGSVFTHLHPSGTISMASQQLFARREKVGNPNQRPGEAYCGPQGNEASFPYEFPKAGRYRIWVQTKARNQILTEAFFVDVLARPGK